MNEMPIRSVTIITGILAHRCGKQPVLEYHSTQLEFLVHLGDLSAILRVELGILDERSDGLRVCWHESRVAWNGMAFGGGRGGVRHDGVARELGQSKS